MKTMIAQDQNEDAEWRRFQRVTLFLWFAPVGLNILLTSIVYSQENIGGYDVKNFLLNNGLAWVPNAAFHLDYLSKRDESFAHNFASLYILSHMVLGMSLVLSVTAFYFVARSVKSQFTTRAKKPTAVHWVVIGIMFGSFYKLFIYQGEMYSEDTRYSVISNHDLIFGINFYFGLAYFCLVVTLTSLIIQVLRSSEIKRNRSF